MQKGGEERLSDNNEIARALAEAIVQAAKYVKRDANEFSNSAIKNTKIYGNQIRQNSIPGFMLKDGSVPTAKIRELSAEVARIAIAEIAVADIEFAQIKNVVIDNAHIGTAGIDYAHIKDLDAESAYFGSQIFELGLGESLYMDRLRVNTANIAHLEVGELILEDAEGDLYKIGIDEFGNVITTLYEVQYQNIATNTKNLMSQYTVYRGAEPPSTPYVDQLWVNTATDIIYRCVAIIPEEIWEPVKANELHTSYINAVETGLEILSTGAIDVKNGGSININNGGNINVDSMGNINLEAGGKINLDSASDIVIDGQNLVSVISDNIDLSANESVWIAASNVARNSTGQQVVIEFTNGAILDEDNFTTTASLKVYHNGLDISENIPAEAVRWERISDSDDTEWNAAHIGVKSVVINGADVDFRGVLRLKIDGIVLTSTASVVDGELILSGIDSDDFRIIEGELVYIGLHEYTVVDDVLYVETVIAAFQMDAQLSNLKTSFLSIRRDGIDVYSDGEINIATGAKLNILSGGDVDIVASGKVNVLSGGKIDVASGADIDVYAGGKIKIAANDLEINGQTITAYADDMIVLAVRGIRVGVTNLLLGTLTQKTVSASALIYEYSDDSEVQNQECILSFDFTSSGADGYFRTRDFVTNQNLSPNIYLSSIPSGHIVGVPIVLGATAGTGVQLVWVGRTKGTLTIYNMKLEKGNKATSWSPSPDDPAGSVKTSYIIIEDEKIDVATGGELNLTGAVINIDGASSIDIASGGELNISGGAVDIQSDDVEFKNANGETLMSISTASGGEPTGQLIIGSESMPMKIGGNYVLPVENGGTGQAGSSNMVRFFAAYPDNAIGNNGDLAVFVNMASGTYGAIGFAHHTAVSGNATFCGLTRNWNSISPSGWSSAGNANATGTSNLYASAWSFSFASPDTISRLAVNFDSAKYLSATWYGWNVSSYITIAVCSSDGTILGSTSFLPKINEMANVVNIDALLKKDTTYYLIMYDNTASATKSKFIAEITSVSSPAFAEAYNCGLFVKHGGLWTLLSSGSG